VEDDNLLGEVVPVEGAEEVDTPVPDFLVPKYLSSVLYQICEAWSWVNGAGNEEAMNAWPMFEQLKPMPGKPGRSIKVRTKMPLVLGRISAKMNKHGESNPNLGRWYFGRAAEDKSGVKAREYVRFQQWLDESTYYTSGALKQQVPFLYSLLVKEWGVNLPTEQFHNKWLSYDTAWKKALFTVYKYCEEDPISISDANLMLLFAHEELPDEEFFQELEEEAKKVREPSPAQEIPSDQ